MQNQSTPKTDGDAIPFDLGFIASDVGHLHHQIDVALENLNEADRHDADRLGGQLDRVSALLWIARDRAKACETALDTYAGHHAPLIEGGILFSGKLPQIDETRLQLHKAREAAADAIDENDAGLDLLDAALKLCETLEPAYQAPIVAVLCEMGNRVKVARDISQSVVDGIVKGRS